MKIKFQYRDKVHVLAPQTKSLQEIKQGIMSRYPSHFKWGVIAGVIKNNAIHQFESWDQIVEETKKLGGKSLKIQVFEKPQSFFQEEQEIRNSNSKLIQKVEIIQIKKSQLREEDLEQDKINVGGNVVIKSQCIQQDCESEQDIKLKLYQAAQQKMIDWIKKQSIASNFKGDVKQLVRLLQQMGIDEKTPRELLHEIISNMD